MTNLNLLENLIRQLEPSRLWLDSSKLMFIVLDSQGRIRFLNQWGCNLLGKSWEEIEGKELFSTFFPGAGESDKAVFMSLMSGRLGSVESYECPVLNKAGEERIIRWHNITLTGPDGKPFGTLSTALDITEEIIAAKKLQEYQRKTNAITESSLDAIVIVDEKGRITLFNPAAEKMFGYPCYEILGQKFFTALAPEAYHEISDETFINLQETGSSEVVGEIVEMVGRQKDGAHFPIEVSLASYEVENGFWIVATIRDISERKQMEMAEQERKRQLELFSSLLRHDLRNDLGIILGNMDILKLQNDRNDSELLEIVNSTEAVAERMENLLNAMSRETDCIETNPAILVTSAGQQAERTHKNLTVNILVDEDAKSLLIPNCRMLPMVFENIFRNAAVHAGDNPLVNASVSKNNGTVEIVVQDDGPGIAEEVRCCLFQKGASTRDGGLGLYLSREILAAIEGSIELIEDDETPGAAFRIVLPLVDQETWSPEVVS